MPRTASRRQRRRVKETTIVHFYSKHCDAAYDLTGRSVQHEIGDHSLTEITLYVTYTLYSLSLKVIKKYSYCSKI